MTTTESVFHELVFEPIPDPPARPPGKGREPVKWEDHLAPLESKLHNSPARLWAYETKTAATSRAAAVRGRLTDAAPTKNWEFKVRPVPNSTLHGVYAVFHGDHTPEQVLANAKARQERKDKLAAARAASTATVPAPAATEPPQTAKEKLAQAAKGGK
jgi:hypothetical protein